MLQITVNSHGAVRREKLFGREHFVVPLTMIVPGVLNGSQGPLLYTAEGNAESVERWNGMPIVSNHPYDDEGNPLSARRPDILNKSGVGIVLGAKTNENGNLGAEGWFDVQLTKSVNPTAYNKLLNNQQFELSTGIFDMDVAEAPDGAVHNGVAYKGIASNYEPDHLAILTEGTGACSINDGCGVLVNEDGTQIIDESDEEAKGLWNKVVELFKNRGNVSNDMSQFDVRSALAEQLRSRFNQSQERVFLEDVFEQEGYVVYSQGADTFRLGFTREGDTVTLSSDTPTKGNLVSQFVVTSNTPSNGETMNMTKEQRKEKVDSLITNCTCEEGKPKFTEDDREYLNGLDERVLNSISTGEQSSGSGEGSGEGKNGASNESGDTGKPKGNTETQSQANNGQGSGNQGANNGESPNGQQKEITENDLPESVRNRLAWADKEMEARKKTLISKLVANVADEGASKRLTEKYSKLSLDELESRYDEMRTIAPENFVENEDQGGSSPDYSGASSYVQNRGEKPVPMGLPSWEGQFAG